MRGKGGARSRSTKPQPILGEEEKKKMAERYAMCPS
jgi:hypothetical protein